MANGSLLEISPTCQQDVVWHALLHIALQPLEQVHMAANGNGALNELEIVLGILRHRTDSNLHILFPDLFFVTRTGNII